MTDEVEARISPVRRMIRALLWPLRHLRFLIVLVIALAVLLLLYNAWLMRRVAEVRAEIQAAGGMVSVEALKVPGLRDASNATVPYRHAMALLERSNAVKEAETALRKLHRQMAPACLPQPELRRRDLEAGMDQPLSAEDVVLLARYLEESVVAMRFVDEGNTLPHFRLGPDEYAPGQVPVVPLNPTTTIRQLGRHISYQALLALRSGDIEQAFHWTWAGLRVAEQMQQEPFLINGLVQCALTHLAAETLQTVLSNTPPDIAVPSAIQEGLQPLRRMESWIFTLESERLYPMLSFGQTSGGPVKFIWLNSELSMHAHTAALVGALRAPSFAEREAILAPLRAQEPVQQGLPIWDVSAMMLPAWLRSMDAHLRAVAQADLAWIAIALHAYRQEQGQYPQGLAEAMDDAPLDPFSGQPYRYEREGDGYRMWSVGLDRDDDGGEPGKAPQGDVLWCLGG